MNYNLGGHFRCLDVGGDGDEKDECFGDGDRGITPSPSREMSQ